MYTGHINFIYLILLNKLNLTTIDNTIKVLKVIFKSGLIYF